jgi:4-diphosphocytidyl-2-C-methyl-D-erythritol kinase
MSSAPESESGRLPRTRVVEARAKVNLFLRVLGLRQDGYHDLETAILPISLADRLEIHAAADPTFRTLALTLDVTGEPDLTRRTPRDESNLGLRAAVALAERTGVRGFADVSLEKRVPVAAGLGGGSADAAATLIALNELWRLGLSPAELGEVGAGVGSDIPALLATGPVLARGRGELVEPVPVQSLRWYLSTFPFGIRTADAYAWWDQDGAETGPDPSPLLELGARGDPSSIGELLFNDLEGPVAARHPEIGEAMRRLRDAGALGTILCGSGPTVAGLFPANTEIDLPDAIEVWSLGTIEGQ